MAPLLRLLRYADRVASIMTSHGLWACSVEDSKMADQEGFAYDPSLYFAYLYF